MAVTSHRVILTRPAGQGRAWREALQAAGHDVLDWPLIDTRPMASPEALVQAWRERATCRAWMFVSAPAVQHFFAQRPPEVDLNGLRCWATGPGTRRALQQCGVPDDAIIAPPDDAAQFDTEHLWQQVQGQVATWLPGQTMAIVRGTEMAPAIDAGDVRPVEQTGVGRDWLAQQLSGHGVQVRWVVAYRRGPPVWDEVQRARARQAAGDGSVWVFSSSLAVQYLTALLPDVSWARARAVATHDRIADALRARGWGHVTICKPQAGELLSRLASLESSP
jgi:uroporphyrinogen-III synthase